jgi:hypothetical protein
MLFRAVVMLYTCIQKAAGCYLGQVIRYTEILIVFSSIFAGDARNATFK